MVLSAEPKLKRHPIICSPGGGPPAPGMGYCGGCSDAFPLYAFDPRPRSVFALLVVESTKRREQFIKDGDRRPV